MKKYLIAVLLVFSSFTLTACGENATTPESEDSQYNADATIDVPSETSLDYYCMGANEADVSAALESLAGVWDWVDAGRIIYIYADGIGYQRSGGDADFRGKIELTQDGESFIVEFTAFEAIGPGAMHDSYGNIREEAFNEAGEVEHDWLPVYGGPVLMFSGTYNPYNDKFEIIFGSPWYTRYELVRRNQSLEASESAVLPDTVGVPTPFTGVVSIFNLDQEMEGNFDLTTFLEEFPDTALIFSKSTFTSQVKGN